MNFRKGRAVMLAAAAAGVAVLAGCSGLNVTVDDRLTTLDYTYAVITHASQGDAFWDRVKSGAERAGSDYGVTVTYSSDPDPAKQAQLIDNAVAQQVDGIVVSMANPDGLQASLAQAEAAGIPFVTINSGMEQSAEFGAITHIGQSETLAGLSVGQRLADDGWRKVLCVIHEAGNVGHEARCAAVREKLAAVGGTVDNVQVDANDDAQVKATLKARLQADPAVDGVLTLGAQYGLDAVGAIEESGSTAQAATFDLTEDVVQAVIDGQLLFAVDQQPYLQGYLGVTTLYLKDINGNDVGGGQPVYSGPAYVTVDNAAEILTYAQNGTR
ncbi:MAG: substrate-binding domain-containing protein [Propionibacteriaceae bacterium]|jgi:simple sugar transport system substrate-binding protein|nr:substrate-binding domain-containing protein [Propionibacteriaceae bacterium]